ncbi:hypothetical protein ACE193_02505 [Bernardetia sp. OM2101]|uniref:hypothetical protein n=1 Tax=Bernardetia sp. OM2101 TaxID=3344876 RepID=UPI0035CF4303
MRYLLVGDVFPKPFHFYEGYRGVERNSLPPDFLKEIGKTNLFNKCIDIIFFSKENDNNEEELSVYKSIVDFSNQYEDENFEVIAILEIEEDTNLNIFLGYEIIFPKNNTESAIVYFLREIGGDTWSLREKYLDKLNDFYLFNNLSDADNFMIKVESIIEKSEPKDEFEDYHDEMKIVKIFSVYN